MLDSEDSPQSVFSPQQKFGALKDSIILNVVAAQIKRKRKIVT